MAKPVKQLESQDEEVRAAGARRLAAAVMRPAPETLTPYSGFGFRIQRVGCRMQGVGCRVQGAGCRVWGVEFQV